ncbi:hypothetical protein [Agrobacterium tumefaciens]|uniref:hypothetical protein n=1 Tax=Agrobacterium tumefaciens TaxID=358 RepID=UPI0015740018|nr:hypothetical protein [Agrobacterium tumefaciens]
MRMAVAAKSVETKASFGHTRSIEDAMGVASPNRIVHDMPRDHSVNSHQRALQARSLSAASSRHVTAAALPFRSTPSPIGGSALPTVRQPSPSSTGWCLILPARTVVRMRSPQPSAPTPHRLAGTEDVPGLQELAE